MLILCNYDNTYDPNIIHWELIQMSVTWNWSKYSLEIAFSWGGGKIVKKSIHASACIFELIVHPTQLLFYTNYL